MLRWIWDLIKLLGVIVGSVLLALWKPALTIPIVAAYVWLIYEGIKNKRKKKKQEM